MTAPRIAVLGLGSVGSRHACNFVSLGAAVQAYDPDITRCAKAEELGSETASGRAAALSHAQAVVIATPNAYHLDDMWAAIEHGCHIFLEKPAAHTAGGMEEALKAADKRDLLVFAAFNLRYRPVIQAAKELLDDGALGTILWARILAASYLPDWRPWQDHREGYAADPLTGGILFDNIHDFDLAYHLLGPGRTVAAAARCSRLLGIESDDCADVVVRHDHGAQTSLHLDYLTQPPRRRIEIAGTAGFLEVSVRPQRLALMDTEGNVMTERTWPGAAEEDYKAEIKAFLECLDGKAEPLCDGWQALDVLRQVIDARRMSGLPARTDA